MTVARTKITVTVVFFIIIIAATTNVAYAQLKPQEFRGLRGAPFPR